MKKVKLMRPCTDLTKVNELFDKVVEEMRMSGKLENAIDGMGDDLESSKFTDMYGGSGVIEDMSDEQKAQLKAEAADILAIADDTVASASKEPDDRKKEDDLIYAVLDAKTSHHRLHDIFKVKPGQEPVMNFMSVLFYGDTDPIDVKKAEMNNGKLVLTLVNDRIVQIGPTQQWTGVLINHNAKVKEIRVRGYARDVTRSIRLQKTLDGILQQIDK